METSLPIVGMSPGNSYFKEDKISFLLGNLLEKHERVAVMIADIPAIATYIALGYQENRARTDKAVRNGNNIKNRVRKVIEEKGIDSSRVIIIDWENQVESSDAYQAKYEAVREMYEKNDTFRNDFNSTTESVLKFSRKDIVDIDYAIGIAVHYLLSEFAFLEFAGEFFGVSSVQYVYHNNWPVYEKYISGFYDDNDRRKYLKFLLLEHPTETFVEMINDVDLSPEETALQRIKRTGLVFAGYAIYENAFFVQDGVIKGIFHDLLKRIADDNNWEIVWTHEVGYGAIVDSLDAKRFDVFASTAWPTEERLEKALFSKSLFESDVYSWCREDFEEAGTLRIAVKENDISHSLAKRFPDTELVFMEQLADTKELLRMVVDRRADFTFVEESLAIKFNASSKEKVRLLNTEKVETYGNSFMFRVNETGLVSFINKEIERLAIEGYIGELLRRYPS